MRSLRDRVGQLWFGRDRWQEMQEQIERSRLYNEAFHRRLDSFDVLPPRGIPQPPPDPDGSVRLALPEDFDQ